MALNRFRSLIDTLEYGAVRLAGKICGISLIIRYLRNPNPSLTVRMLRAFGATIGPNSTFKRGVFLDNVYGDSNSAGDFSHLRVGANCYIGEGVYFDLADDIILEDDAVISGQVAFVTHADCNRSAYLAQRFPRQCRPVQVGRGAWVGFRATLLVGVSVGPEAVIAAHALVRGPVEARTLNGGIPSKTIRPIEESPEAQFRTRDTIKE